MIAATHASPCLAFKDAPLAMPIDLGAGADDSRPATPTASEPAPAPNPPAPDVQPAPLAPVHQLAAGASAGTKDVLEDLGALPSVLGVSVVNSAQLESALMAQVRVTLGGAEQHGASNAHPVHASSAVFFVRFRRIAG